MTPKEFEKIVRFAKPSEVASAMAGLGEVERKSLAKVIKPMRKAVETCDGQQSDEMDWERLVTIGKEWIARHPHTAANLALATLGCCSAAEAHRADIWQARNGHSEDLARTLIDRKPSWLNTWVGRKIGGEWPELDWALVFTLYRAGVIDKPAVEAYTSIFAREMNSFDQQKPLSYIPLSERLRAEPELLEDEFWRLFDYETAAFTNNWSEKYHQRPDNYESWLTAVPKLVDSGDLDRDRVLDASLAALTREFKQNYLNGFIKLHQSLNPDVEEIKARESCYLGLLTSPTGLVLSFSLRMIATLKKAGALDAERFLAAAGPVLSHKAKGTAMQVLSIANALASNDQTLVTAARGLAAAGVSHPVTDVQELALDIIASSAREEDAAFAAVFERQMVHLSPKLATRAADITRSLTPNGREAVEDSRDSFAADSVIEEIRELPDSVRRTLKLTDDDLAAGMPSPLDFDIVDLPTLVNSDELLPVASVEELLELAAQLIESVESADEIERLLDGIARMGHDRGGNFERLAAPLIQRLQHGAGTSSYGLGSYWSGFPLAFADMLISWLTGKRHDSEPSSWYRDSGISTFVACRLQEILEVTLEKKPFVMFATPTHSGGWIASDVFVTRAKQVMESGQTVRAADLMQGLLRIAPAGRRAALARAENLPGIVGRLTRYALGGGEPPLKKDRRDAPLWVCAARCRSPDGDFAEEFSAIAGATPQQPDLLMPATYDWRTEVKKEQYYTSKRLLVSVQAKDAPPVRATPMQRLPGMKQILESWKRVDWAKWPVAALHQRARQTWYSFYELSAPWRIDWLSMTWPTHAEPYFGFSIEPISQRIDMDTSRDAPVHAYVSALFDDNRCWGDMANLLLCLSLISKSTDTRGFAVDAAIAGVETGRADSTKIAVVFGELALGGFLKPNRLAEALQQIAIVSSLHRWWVAVAVTKMIAAFEGMPKGAHFFFDLALECLTPIGATVPDATRDFLQTVKGSSKAAKMAKELLALEGPSLESPSAEIVAEALAARLALAQAMNNSLRLGT